MTEIQWLAYIDDDLDRILLLLFIQVVMLCLILLRLSFK